MDREIAALERQLAADDARPPALVLRLARAYARSGEREEAWALYWEVEGKDAELDAVGRALSAAEQPLLAQLPESVEVIGAGDEERPVWWLRIAAAPAEPALELPRLPLVIDVEFLGRVTAAHVRALQVLPRLRRLTLRDESGWDEPNLLEPGVVQAVLELPALRGLELNGYACGPETLFPLGGLGERLRVLRLGWLEGLGAHGLDWLPRLEGLRELALTKLDVSSRVLDGLPPTLTSLRMFHAALEDDAALRRLLRRRRLEELDITETRALEGAAWVADVPASVTCLRVDQPQIPLEVLVACAARLPDLETLDVVVERDSDLRRLAALGGLKALSLRGPLSDARLEQLVPLLPRLRSLDVDDDAALGAAGLALVLEHFRGESLNLQLNQVPVNRLQALGELPVERLVLAVTPLTDEAAKDLETQLSQRLDSVLVFGRRSNSGYASRYDAKEAAAEVLQLARLGLEDHALGSWTRWRDVPNAEQMRQVLRDAYGIDDPAILGKRVRNMIANVQVHLAP